MSVLWRKRHDGVAVGAAEERRRRGDIPVVEIALDELKVAAVLSGARIENDDRSGVEVRSVAKVLHEVRRRIAAGDIDEAALGVERIARPRAAAADRKLRIVLPTARGRSAGSGWRGTERPVGGLFRHEEELPQHEI